MKKVKALVLIVVCLMCVGLAACSSQGSSKSSLEDGTYIAEFKTDSSMFHAADPTGGKCVLTVKNGKMTIHVPLVSKNIVNLYVGKAEKAQKDSKNILNPTTEKITYPDGLTEEVYAFDIPVPEIGVEFDCALIGKKGSWYDHKVSVSNPEKYNG